jgi:acyl-CoA hydrolase
LTTTAFVTMVAVDVAGRPRTVPGLEARDAAERERAAQATRRREARLASRRPERH